MKLSSILTFLLAGLTSVKAASPVFETIDLQKASTTGLIMLRIHDYFPEDMCLASRDGDVVQLETCDPTDGHFYWKVKDVGGGYYTIERKGDYTLDCLVGGTSGAAVKGACGGDNSKWTTERRGDNYRLLTKASGTSHMRYVDHNALDKPQMSTDQGGYLEYWLMAFAPTEAPTSTPTKAPSTSAPTTAPATVAPTSAPSVAPVEATPVTGSSSGDPHFKTWAGEKYDFHGTTFTYLAFISFGLMLARACGRLLTHFCLAVLFDQKVDVTWYSWTIPFSRTVLVSKYTSGLRLRLGGPSLKERFYKMVIRLWRFKVGGLVKVQCTG